MALPHLVKFIYNNAPDEVIRRGKKIHTTGFVEMIDHDELMGNVSMRVKDDVYSTFYKVNIQRFTDADNMNVRCSCPYNLSEICRHEAAALFRLQDLIDKNLLRSSAIQYDQRHTVAKMKTIDLKMLRMLSSPALFHEAEKILRNTKANIISAGNDRVEAELNLNGTTYPLVIQKNDERNFDTSCLCNEAMQPLCEHKIMLFLQLLNSYGANYFESIRNWDKDKNKLLQIYGYSLSDDLTGKFEFIYKEGKPFLKVLDPSIKRLEAVPVPEKPAMPLQQGEKISRPEVETEFSKKAEASLALLFNFNEKMYPYFSIDLVQGEKGDDKLPLSGKVEKIDLTKYVDTDSYSEDDKALFQQVRKLQPIEINKYLNRSSPFGGFWENIVHADGDELPEETRRLITEYMHPRVKKVFEDKRLSYAYILPAKKAYKTENLQAAFITDEQLTPQFNIYPLGKNFVIECNVKTGNGSLDISDNKSPSQLLFLNDGSLYLWKTVEDVEYAEKVVSVGRQKISSENWHRHMVDTILPLSKKYDVVFDKSLTTELRDVKPEVRVELHEKGSYLIFQPEFIYKGFSVKPGGQEKVIIPDNGKILIIYRNLDFEKAFVQKLEALHSHFMHQHDTGGLVLKGPDVLKNNWFFLFIDAMKEMKVPVYGFESLRNFRFNTARPSTRIHVSSGLDWFDANVEIDFGSQKVGIAEIKQALSTNQSFVQLGDGTLGILPEEWLKKYALLFKVGNTQAGSLRLSKYHLSVIDDLYDNRSEEELSFALDEKFEKLREFKNIPQVAPPEHLESTLRPYQLAGYQWLNYLNDVGWGGILADDMGLGKTIQALTMLEAYKTNNQSLLAIVICPTTLIFNWANEVKKFTPALSHHIHHGNLRTRAHTDLGNYDIVITTYGTLRSDIAMLLKLKFDYIILDESQAIKNPSSKVTKAASLLQGKNRVCMSGTPLQNNTFDIFAQMNFLNPGLLGSMEFFRNEFATPIDKFGEKENKEHLRKLLYPFILRRTKEQVAKDLPEKTETVLYCEMGDEQRKIYDAFRNSYRDKIMGTIEQQGIEKSQLTILQGLMKLRQICDSPAILNEQEKYPNHSIKLEELSREVEENITISGHKALIFSQFLGMLDLIRKKLTTDGITYEYFDGSTSATDREKAIRNFQENDDCRVFLISLKAGGVGLNLTAADYVYIVDPWWNPAVEQQAIDRTHRIGQTKNIFAYRMICIDSIEDKILQLQEKKRSLAKELIADDAHFVKSLTKADVEYLFG